jgi:hypothetical protein
MKGKGEYSDIELKLIALSPFQMMNDVMNNDDPQLIMLKHLGKFYALPKRVWSANNKGFWENRVAKGICTPIEATKAKANYESYLAFMLWYNNKNRNVILEDDTEDNSGESKANPE